MLSCFNIIDWHRSTILNKKKIMEKKNLILKKLKANSTQISIFINYKLIDIIPDTSATGIKGDF